MAGIHRNHSHRLFDRPANDSRASLQIAFKALDQLVHSFLRPQQRGAAARNDAFFDRSLRGMKSVFDSGFQFLHLEFGCRSDANHGNAAGEFRQPFLQLFTIVVGRGVFDLGADLLDPAFDRSLLAGTFDDRRVVFIDRHLLHVLEFQPEIFRDGAAAGQGRDVFHDRFAPIAECRRLDGNHFQRPADLVHDQSRQGFAFDFLGDDHERTALAGNLFQDGNQIAHGRDFLLMDQDERIFHNGFHAIRIGDEIRRQIAAVELHTFDEFQFGLHRLGFFDGDDTVFADLFHRFRDQRSDRLVVVGGYGRNLRLLFVAFHRFRNLLQLFHDDFNGLVDAAFQIHRVGARSDVLDTFAIDRLSQDSRARRTVAGKIAGLAGNFLHHLRSHVLVAVRQLDFLGNRHSVFRHQRTAELATCRARHSGLSVRE